MAVTAQQLLEYAQAINSNDELSQRAAINRAYYAAYHAARLFHGKLSSPGRLPAGPAGVHETLYHQLVHPTLPQSTDEMAIRSKQIGYKAKDIRQYRVSADYSLDEPVVASDVEYVIQAAIKTLELAN